MNENKTEEGFFNIIFRVSTTTLYIYAYCFDEQAVCVDKKQPNGTMCAPAMGACKPATLCDGERTRRRLML